MQVTRSDALVLFGATGDLAYRKIFPALQALTVRDGLDVPIIGVAHSGWSVEKLRKRAHASLVQAAKTKTASRRGRIRYALARLQYVDGDYNDAATFQSLKKALGAHAGRFITLPFHPICSRP